MVYSSKLPKNSKLQSDGYETGYFHKIWMEYYCLGKNKASEMFCSKLIRCKSPCRLQNLKILLILWSHKNPCGQNFWNLNFFIPEKLRLYRYYQNKNQLGFTSSSYINTIYNKIVDKV